MLEWNEAQPQAFERRCSSRSSPGVMHSASNWSQVLPICSRRQRAVSVLHIIDTAGTLPEVHKPCHRPATSHGLAVLRSLKVAGRCICRWGLPVCIHVNGGLTRGFTMAFNRFAAYDILRSRLLADVSVISSSFVAFPRHHKEPSKQHPHHSSRGDFPRTSGPQNSVRHLFGRQGLFPLGVALNTLPERWPSA